MKAVVLFRPKSEHEGIVEGYVREYKRFKNITIEMVSLNTREGSDMARLYGITQYPAVLAIAENGSLQKMWQGELLPTINDLEYYTREAAHYSLHSHNRRP